MAISDQVVLVTGGAGYVGSHAVRALIRAGRRPVVVDDLSTGHAAAVPLGVPLVRGTLGDPSVVAGVFADYAIEAVLHFAARSVVGASMRRPLDYLRDNIVDFGNLLEGVVANGCPPVVLSSTAAVYAPAGDRPIEEDHPIGSANPYGVGKAYAEEMLAQIARTHGLRSVALRYFNAAGAEPGGAIGEDHRPETHLIPRLLQTALGQFVDVELFGDDYPTADGTAVRDYVHVSDLADAHVRALDYLLAGGDSARLNLGSGIGFSVSAVLAAARATTGHPIPARVGPRRAGDPAVLVASRNRAEALLGWVPVRSDLPTIMADAWAWHARNPHGYPS